ncbi:MAG: Flp family type IVb pilin [Terracidiphilus sp.]
MRLGLRYLMLRLQLLTDADDGQDLVEYCLIAALISMACVASTSAFARLLLQSFNSITTTFDGYI